MPMIVNNVAYRNGKRLREITLEEISNVLKEPSTFVWLGLREPDLACLEKIQEEFSLHELAIEDAQIAHQRPKIEVYGDSLFIVLKTAQLEGKAVKYGETHLFIGKNFLVSIRHGASASYADVRENCENTAKMLSKGSGFALYALMDFVVDNYEPIVSQFENKFDKLEAAIFKGEFNRPVIERLYDLKREMLQLRNAVLPVDEICNQLMRFHEEIIHKELRVYFRDIQDHVNLFINTTDSLREMLTTAMQVNLALVAVVQNDVVRRLAGWGAILAIPTVIFSLYGMNFDAMPELEWRFGYPATILATLLGCFFLYRKLKSAGWL